MKSTYKRATAFALASLLGATGLVVPVRAQTAQDDPFEKLKSYDFQSRAPVAAIDAMIQQSLSDKTKMAEIEKHLLSVLQDMMSTFAGKQEACRMISIIGTARSVPALFMMLSDEKQANIARYALERIADPEAGKALLSAAASAQGSLLIGDINSLGDRGDPEAVEVLKNYVTASDALVAEAAISALGKIHTPNALNVLRTLPADNLVAGHSMLRTGEYFATHGKKNDAMHLFEGLAKEGRPLAVRGEALRGLSTLQTSAANAIVLVALKSPDPYLQEIAARLSGSMPDPQSTSHAIAIWPDLAPEMQTVLLSALADRHEPKARPLALAAIDSKDAGVRAEGIQAAAKLGGAQAVPRLIDVAMHGEGSDRNTARTGLASMPGAEAEQALLKAAQEGPSDVRAMLMGVLSERKNPAVLSALLAAAGGMDTRVAIEAIRALGRVGSVPEHAELVKILVNAQNDQVRDAAKEAVVALGQRFGDQDKASAPVLAAYPGATMAGKAALLPILAEIGGSKSLDELTQATNSKDLNLRQVAISALTDTWTDSGALPTLLSLARSDADKSVKIQALRGYLRIVGQDEGIPANEKVQKIEQALVIAERPEEKKQALSILRDCRVPAAVALTTQLMDDPNIFSEAADTALYLAENQKKNNRNQAAVKGTATTAALDKIIQLTKDDNQRALAQKLK